LSAFRSVIFLNMTNEPITTQDPADAYEELVREITNEMAAAQAEAHCAVNTTMIGMYWRIGRLITDPDPDAGEIRDPDSGRAPQDGAADENVLARLSADLRAAYPGQAGFGRASLTAMVKMARTWPDGITRHPAGQLPWTCIRLLMDRVDTRAALDFYAGAAVHNGLSRDELESCVTADLFNRRAAAAPYRFKTAIPDGAPLLAEIAKDPYRLDFCALGHPAAGRSPEEALIHYITAFLQDLGLCFGHGPQAWHPDHPGYPGQPGHAPEPQPVRAPGS